MKKAFLFFTTLGALLGSFFSVAIARADLIPDPNTQSSRITQNQPANSLNGTLDIFTTRASTVVFLLIGGLAVVLIVLAGMRYISSAGNPDRIKQARQSIIQIVLGIIILIATYYVVNLLIGAAGLISPISS